MENSGPDPDMVQSAKQMCVELLGTVKQSYDAFKERGPRGSGGGGFQGDRYNPNSDRGGYNARERHPSGSYGGGSQYGGSTAYDATPGYNPTNPSAGYGGAQSPTAAAQQAQSAAAMAHQMQTPEQQQQIQAWSAYYAQNPQEDPYAAYGGYGPMMAQYMSNPQYYAQMTGAAQQPGVSQSPSAGMQNGGGYDAPPPPPPDNSSSVPPPPPGAGGYNSVSDDVSDHAVLRMHLTINAKVPPPPGM